MTTLEAHPAALFFPLLGEEEFKAFKADIATNGLHEPIWLCDEKILDGRNRYRACLELGIVPAFRPYTGASPVAFAWSLNGERRHLTNGQRSAIGVEMLPALHEEAKKRQVGGLRRGVNLPVPANLREREPQREAVETAAAIVGASATNIRYARAVKDRDPGTFEKIKTGELNVWGAYQRVKDTAPSVPARCQPKAVRVAAIRKLAQDGNRSAQISAALHISQERVNELAREANIRLPDALIGHKPAIKVHRVLEETVSTLEGLALGLRTVSGQRFECDSKEASEWLQSIDASLRIINKVRKYLRSCMS